MVGESIEPTDADILKLIETLDSADCRSTQLMVWNGSDWIDRP